MKFRHSHGNWGFVLGLTGLAAAAALAVLSVPPAHAQESTGNYLNAADTMSCICWEDELAEVDSELLGPDVSAVRNEFTRVDQLLRQAHAGLDPNDKAEVESVQRISERRTLLKQQLDQAEFPLLRRKAALASHYNVTCAGKKMFMVNVDAARKNPNCPATP
jgi:hypothetical protein